jgi:hypothetical protein
MRLRIDTVPPLLLPVLDAGAERHAINGEVPSVPVTADNARGEAAAVLAVPPLRAPAQLLGDDDQVLFVGRVQSVSLADVATLVLES